MAKSGMNWLKFPELEEDEETSENKKTMSEVYLNGYEHTSYILSHKIRTPCLPKRGLLEGKFTLLCS